MKICPRCMRQFQDAALQECPDDGTRLRAFRDQTSQLLGKLLDDRWLIEEKIGEGGMGEVYRARQANMDRVVAIKVLRLALASSEQYVTRFFREADIATSVQHPHFVSIYDFGQTSEDQLLYIAMELLDGEPLADVLRSRRLPLDDALTIACQVCAAMSAAHAARIVHRDLKPDNIFLLDVPEGGPFVKVLDFGIAKDLDDTNQVTRTGQLFGTPEYMSPEQCEATDGVDGRSDLYALGCILYEVLTGRSPFQRDSIIQTLLAQVNEPPQPFSDIGVPVPTGVQRIVFRLLEKNPDNRYGDAIEVRDALMVELDRLRQNSGEVRAYETVSNTLPPRQKSARTVSYSELGHPLQLEGVLASSARSAIAKQAERRRQEESEKETEDVDPVDGASRGSHRLAVLLWLVLIGGVVASLAAFTPLWTSAGPSSPSTDSSWRHASVVVAEAADRGRKSADTASAQSDARRRANGISLSAATVVLGTGASNRIADSPTPKSTNSDRESAAALIGVRTQTSMGKRLVRRKRKLLACYDRREGTDDRGDVVFRFIIEPDGSAERSQVRSTSLRSKTVLECMREVASTIQFAPADHSTQFEKVLTFTSKRN